MSPQYTPRQRMAIDLRDCNILVSASAGAGKTAVLTERIVNLLLDKEHPTDIDKIVIVTYTRAAAAEMRSRIAGKLAERLNDEPENVHIQKQLALIAHAHISTIDSFCRNVVSNYFYTIGLDPAFRIVDENETKLIEEELVDELLEEEYGRHEEPFINMMETFAPGKSDRPVCDLIKNLYKMSQSHAFPYEWLDGCCNKFDIEDPVQMEESDWFEATGIMEHIKNVISDCVSREQKAADILNEDKVKYRLDMSGEADLYDAKSAKALDDIRIFVNNEMAMLGTLVKSSGYTEISSRINRLSFERFPVRKLQGELKAIKDEAKGLRDEVKKAIGKLTGGFFYQSPQMMADDIRACAEPVRELVRVTKEFMGRYEQYKHEKNIADFNDIEHYALNILLKNVDGSIVRTDVADELMDRYEYILIDEYQDSNEVQETILAGISRIPIGKPNMFMVGDVKQSIYQFRLAKPDIFEGKLRRYPTAGTPEAEADDVPGKRVLLRKNFRSTRTILKTINYIFPEIMHSAVGRVEYDETHYFDVDVNPEAEACDEPVEAIYVTGRDEDNEYGKMQIEAFAIADRIRELVDPETGMRITEAGVTRTVNYSDIVMLLRSMKGWAEAFVEVLTTKGIPVIAQEQTGYFSAKEIQMMLSMLKVIDNPRQDIPLTSALRSVFGEFNDEELAVIRTKSDGDMYSALCAAAGSGDDCDGLAARCLAFLNMLNGYREKASYMTVYDLMQELFEEKDYLNCMKAMPAGERRAGNLLMLADKALAYEDNDKRGLASFIRYIDRMQKASIDFGEAKQPDGHFGAVKIMSIHKSKGLEFPVVFVSGMGKRVNLMDARNDVIVHTELGPVPDYFDRKKRIKRSSLLKKAVSRKITNDVIGEEIRILYVALTRARTKLIMTGYIPGDCEKINEYRKKSNSYLEMTGGADCYYDWVSPCFARHPAWADTFGGEVRVSQDTEYPRMIFRCVQADDIICREAEELVSKEVRKASLIKEAARDTIDEETFKGIQSVEEYVYPYEAETSFAMKVSVSDIKHAAAVLEDEEAVKASWAATEHQVYIPSFMREETKRVITGADRGTMYHALMEHLDIENITTTDDIENRIRALIDRGILDEAAVRDNVISKRKILAFCKSDVAARMMEADRHGLAAREQPFVMGVPADRVYPESNSKEIIIVQGIIDVYFEEDDGIVLLDYKTDRIGENEEEKLAGRYRAQMACYREAIEKARAKPVKEIILYSFSLNKEIRVDIDE